MSDIATRGLASGLGWGLDHALLGAVGAILRLRGPILSCNTRFAGIRMVFDRLGLQKLVDFGVRETCIGSEIDARNLASISRHDRLQDTIPTVGAVDVAGTQSAAFQIAEGMEERA